MLGGVGGTSSEPQKCLGILCVIIHTNMLAAIFPFAPAMLGQSSDRPLSYLQGHCPNPWWIGDPQGHHSPCYKIASRSEAHLSWVTHEAQRWLPHPIARNLREKQILSHMMSLLVSKAFRGKPKAVAISRYGQRRGLRRILGDRRWERGNECPFGSKPLYEARLFCVRSMLLCPVRFHLREHIILQYIKERCRILRYKPYNTKLPSECGPCSMGLHWSSSMTLTSDVTRWMVWVIIFFFSFFS